MTMTAWIRAKRALTILSAMTAALTIETAAQAATRESQNPAEKITMYSEVIDTPSDVFAAIDRINVHPESHPFSGEDVTVNIDMIVNLAKKTWDIIKANQPVANVQFNFANALPKGLTDSSALTGFSDINSKSLRIWGTNGFGLTVYDVTMTAVHQYGGQYDGKGRYLETVAIVPSNVSVLWGYTVNYSVDNITTTNGGTSENPIAQMTLQAKFKVETVMQKNETNTVFQFRGDSAEVKTSGF